MNTINNLLSSICHNRDYVPGVWLPNLPCPECGENLI